MRVCLFTDTLGDINGVSRFIRNIAEQALVSERELHIITSTRFDCPKQPNIHVVEPVVATRMPRYENLEVVLPPSRALRRLVDRLGPDAIHVSTPGPVGTVGRRIALRRGVPLLGTYHTDFPAYIDHLFDDAAYTWICTRVMRGFYRPFDRIFTRSADYVRTLIALGIPEHHIVRLLPGIATDTFHTRFRDPSIWDRFAAIPRDAVKVLYVGRISIEKNLPFLTRVWKRIASRAALVTGNGSPPRLHASTPPPQLVIVGDGPYRAQMQRELDGTGAHFLGFRHGAELSTIYASADLFVFPSTTDTLGQVVMEAQAAGLPVIVTDQGGPAEVVDHGDGFPLERRTGSVLPADDTRAWADAIMALGANAPLRRAMGAAGHAKILPMGIRHSFEHFWRVHEEAVAESLARV